MKAWWFRGHMLSQMFVIGIKCVLSSRSHALKSLCLLSASVAPWVVVFGEIWCLEGTDPVFEEITFKDVSKGCYSGTHRLRARRCACWAWGGALLCALSRSSVSSLVCRSRDKCHIPCGWSTCSPVGGDAGAQFTEPPRHEEATYHGLGLSFRPSFLHSFSIHRPRVWVWVSISKSWRPNVCFSERSFSSLALASFNSRIPKTLVLCPLMACCLFKICPVRYGRH